MGQMNSSATRDKGHIQGVIFTSQFPLWASVSHLFNEDLE